MPCTHFKDFPHGVEYGVNFFWLQETKYSTNPTKRRRQPTCLQKEISVTDQQSFSSSAERDTGLHLYS